MPEKNYDLIVIGAGPGGYTAAIRASQLGLKTAIVERDRLGGVCLNWGCIPTKALLRNAEMLAQFRKGEEWGISCENLTFDFSKIIQRSRGVAEKVSRGVGYLMKKNNIEVLPGRATLLGDQRVEVRSDGSAPTLAKAPHIIVATGARPRAIPGVAPDGQHIITSSEAMSLQSQPKTMLIIGAGAIGIEFAYFYNTLGTRVTVVEMLPTILPLEDRELTKLLASSLRKQGIEIHTEMRVDGATAGPSSVTVRVSGGEGTQALVADTVLVAVGVQGNVENLGLESVGVKVNKGRVEVDHAYRTSAAGVYAIGDVIGPPWLAHVASAEGVHCVEAIAGKEPPPLDYTSVPACTYCQPQLASVGLTEERATAEGHEVRVGRCQFRPLGKAVAIGESEGMVKLIFDAKYGELLGAHILGSEATEMIAELVVAKNLETTGRDLYHSIHAHPTLSEAVMEAAAAAYGESINI